MMVSRDEMSPSRPKPLSHVRVLDLSRLLPGPMATLHLADLGADVIRIESMVDEEPVPAAQAPGKRLDRRDLLRLMLTRNKRMVRVDLTRTAGREIFLRLAKVADVVVEGFRPGVVDRLGIGYQQVREVNPRVVYCSISGYGQNGPDRLRAGHDINYLACAGVGDQIGISGGPPAIPNLQAGDLLGGSLTSVMGILAGLVDAQARGIGRYVDVAMTDSLMAHSVLALSAMTESGRTAPRGEDMLSGGLPCYNYYRTGDGRYLAVGALERQVLGTAVRRLGAAGPETQAPRTRRGGAERARRVADHFRRTKRGALDARAARRGLLRDAGFDAGRSHGERAGARQGDGGGNGMSGNRKVGGVCAAVEDERF